MNDETDCNRKCTIFQFFMGIIIMCIILSVTIYGMINNFKRILVMLILLLSITIFGLLVFAIIMIINYYYNWNNNEIRLIVDHINYEDMVSMITRVCCNFSFGDDDFDISESISDYDIIIE